MPDANIKAVITADDRASHVLKNFGDNVGGAASRIGGLLKTAAEGLAVAGAAAVGFGALSVKAFSDSEDRIVQTNAVLKSTAQVAGVTADQVTKLATALQKQTKYSDEDVRSVENLLLTFTSIGKDIFPQATKTVLDMATALGEDTKSASIQLGKALQDPVLGITALRRVGVNFSDKQKEVIQHLVDTNQKLAAQKMILKELNTEFGGSAEAAGSTFAGSLAKLKNSLNDVEEKVGQVIVQRLTPFATKALEAIASIDWDKVITKTVTALQDFGGWLKNTYDRIKDVADQVAEYLGPKLEALWNTINTKLIPVLTNLWHNVIEPLLPVLGTTLVIAIGLVIDALNILLTGVSWVIKALQDGNPFVWLFAAAFGGLAAAMAFNAIFDALTVGFATFRLVTIPSTIATMDMLRTAVTTPMAMTIFVAAALAAIDLVYQKGQQTLQLLDKLNKQEADDNTSTSGAMKSVIDAYHAGKISKEQYQKFFSNLAGRAIGGPITANTPYLVGEKGPEVIIPRNNGEVIPNNRLGMGGSTININLNAGAFMGSDVEARKYAQTILNHMKSIAGSKNMTLAQLMGT